MNKAQKIEYASLLEERIRRNKVESVDIDRERSAESLSYFIKAAWEVLEPAQKYTHGWHIDAVCEHLEAITDGQITRLLINIPPGTMKSLLSNVFWPAWEWGPKGLSETRVIGASHEQTLATRDCLKMRRLITSEWYQERWPITLTGDQNAKTHFENKDTGFRLSCPVASMLGKRGDRVIWDDPHSVEASISDQHRLTALRVFDETLPTRLNNPDRSAILIIMQRLHEDDVSGHIIAKELGYDHLMLPMEYDPARHCTTSIGFNDPRKEDGELLFPERFPEHVIERDKKVMGEYAIACQYQQSPAPRGGGMFPVDQFTIIPYLDHNLVDESVRYWDKAGTKHKGSGAQNKAHTAGVLMHRLKDGRFVIEDVQHGQWEALEREKKIKAVAQFDKADTNIWIEQEPGSGGKESAQATIRNLAGFKIRAECPSGDKALRADPYAVQVQGGNVYLVKGDWNKGFKSEHESFPNGKLKDRVDASAGAFNKLVIGSAKPGIRSL